MSDQTDFIEVAPHTIDITKPNGEVKTIRIKMIPALDGWDIQSKFLEFAASTNKDFRRAYTLEVLLYAEVIQSKDHALPLTTGALINNHLGSWQNVERVFNEILLHNGIDPKTHANRPHFWVDAGREMATAFIAEVSELLGPAFTILNAKAQE